MTAVDLDAFERDLNTFDLIKSDDEQLRALITELRTLRSSAAEGQRES